MKTDDLPQSVSEGEITISGVKLRVNVLDDGRRVVRAEDVQALFDAWAAGADLTKEEGDRLTAFLLDRY